MDKNRPSMNYLDHTFTNAVNPIFALGIKKINRREDI